MVYAICFNIFYLVKFKGTMLFTVKNTIRLGLVELLPPVLPSSSNACAVLG